MTPRRIAPLGAGNYSLRASRSHTGHPSFLDRSLGRAYTLSSVFVPWATVPHLAAPLALVASQFNQRNGGAR